MLCGDFVALILALLAAKFGTLKDRDLCNSSGSAAAICDFGATLKASFAMNLLVTFIAFLDTILLFVVMFKFRAFDGVFKFTRITNWIGLILELVAVTILPTVYKTLAGVSFLGAHDAISEDLNRVWALSFVSLLGLASSVLCACIIDGMKCRIKKLFPSHPAAWGQIQGEIAMQDAAEQQSSVEGSVPVQIPGDKDIQSKPLL